MHKMICKPAKKQISDLSAAGNAEAASELSDVPSVHDIVD